MDVYKSLFDAKVNNLLFKMSFLETIFIIFTPINHVLKTSLSHFRSWGYKKTCFM